MDSLPALSPALGLALAAAFVAALVYMAATARPLRALPLYWSMGIVGFATGQSIAVHGLRLVPVGDLALGTGLLVCIVLFVAVHLLTLWYTWGRRPRGHSRTRTPAPRRER